jgi:hypothetical protein
MKRRLFVILLFFSLNSLTVFAQGSASGCLLPDNKVYTNKPVLSGTVYDSSTAVSLSANYCSWTPTSSSTCSVCFNGLINALGLCVSLNGNNPANIVYGTSGTFTMVQCDLDDYTWLFGATASLFGIFIIRKRNKL